jgi:hypothetical protein
MAAVANQVRRVLMERAVPFAFTLHLQSAKTTFVFHNIFIEVYFSLIP